MYLIMINYFYQSYDLKLLNDNVKKGQFATIFLDRVIIIFLIKLLSLPGGEYGIMEEILKGFAVVDVLLDSLHILICFRAWTTGDFVPPPSFRVGEFGVLDFCQTRG